MTARPRNAQNVGELLAMVQGLPRESVPAVLAALAARLAEPPQPPNPPPPPIEVSEGDKLLTVEQTALRLGLDVAAVGRRRFPFARKLGRRTVRYSEEGLARWMKEGH